MRAESVEKVRRICACFRAIVFVRHIRIRLSADDGVQAFMPPQVCC